MWKYHVSWELLDFKAQFLTSVTQRFSGQGSMQKAHHNHICPFLFRAYTPKQAQMPVMLRATPSKRAIASPASTASTTGSTKSSEMRTKSNCVETEVMMLGSSGIWISRTEGFKKRKKNLRIILSDSKSFLPGVPDLF